MTFAVLAPLVSLARSGLPGQQAQTWEAAENVAPGSGAEIQGSDGFFLSFELQSNTLFNLC